MKLRIFCLRSSTEVKEPRFAQGAPGGQIGMVGVLQTWTRDLRYHPHVHYLVPAGALAPTGTSWLRAKPRFLVHVKPLATLFRAKVSSDDQNFH